MMMMMRRMMRMIDYENDDEHDYDEDDEDGYDEEDDDDAADDDHDTDEDNAFAHVWHVCKQPNSKLKARSTVSGSRMRR